MSSSLSEYEKMNVRRDVVCAYQRYVYMLTCASVLSNARMLSNTKVCCHNTYSPSLIESACPEMITKEKYLKEVKRLILWIPFLNEKWVRKYEVAQAICRHTKGVWRPCSKLGRDTKHKEVFVIEKEWESNPLKEGRKDEGRGWRWEDAPMPQWTKK